MQKVHSFAHVIFFIVSNFLEYYILATAFKRFCSVIPYYQLFMSSHDSMLLPSRLCFCLHWYLPVSTITPNSFAQIFEGNFGGWLYFGDADTGTFTAV